MLNKIRPKDKQEFARDLKQVFNNFDKTSTKSQALRKITELKNKWKGMYDKVLNKLSSAHIQDYLTYIKYPFEVRKLIYTTNSIENLNMKGKANKKGYKNENFF